MLLRKVEVSQPGSSASDVEGQRKMFYQTDRHTISSDRKLSLNGNDGEGVNAGTDVLDMYGWDKLSLDIDLDDDNDLFGFLKC